MTAAMTAVADSIPARVMVKDPPVGVHMAVQEGRHALLAPLPASTASRLHFEFRLRLGKPLANGRPNFLGDFAHGTRDQRFVYVNSGTLAAQSGVRWERRAKLMLDGVSQQQIEQLLADDRLVLQATFEGTGCDGGPACARVPLHGDGWQVVARD